MQNEQRITRSRSLQPSLVTPRLRLRPFGPEDAEVVQTMVSERRVADTTLNIPHPPVAMETIRKRGAVCDVAGCVRRSALAGGG
jgi:hypothetical protein